VTPAVTPAVATWVLRCSGCAVEVPLDRGLVWACPGRVAGDDIDHVLVPVRDLTGMALPMTGSDNPFVRYRRLLASYERWSADGGSDAGFVDLVEELDAAVAAVDGAGFRVTPLRASPALGRGAWVKDETGGVAGSHKGRHLMGVLLHLLVAERHGSGQPEAPLAIASCGNAALAAAVLARVACRRLLVFIPPEADTPVVERLRDLGAEITVCRRRDGVPGDPCHHAFVAAVAAGAVPFSCQGRDNGLTIEGGATLGWELATQLAADGVAVERVVIQVGGGALASATMSGLADAVALGALRALPTLHAVQTDGAWPLVRAHHRVVAAMAAGATPHQALAQAGQHRSRYMWPWERVPYSAAEGIVDDETYDWLAVVGSMVRTGGSAVVVGDGELWAANRRARAATGLDVSVTGSAGLAGLAALMARGDIAAGERVVLLFTGVGGSHRRPPP
jgi:threonine synthase